MSENTDNEGTEPRSRTKHACEPCKTRKRKCDGHNPCKSCRRYNYQCTFAAQHRRRSNKIATATASIRPETTASIQRSDAHHSTSNNSSPETINVHSVEANSGVLFPSLLGARLHPQNKPKLQGLGWNLGLHYQNPHSERSIIWILSEVEWQSLFNTYLERIHCIYSFLDLDVVRSESARRWRSLSATNHYDHVLCGIAALASLFSKEKFDDREPLLVDCAKDVVESSSLAGSPTVHDAQAWLLRLLYLRCNSPPHPVWMASSITMQIIEATGLHQEENSMPGTVSKSEGIFIDVECRRKTFWLAQLLNAWISNEYGRSSSKINGATCHKPKSGTEDAFTGLMTLYEISSVLAPYKNVEIAEFQASLSSIQSLQLEVDALILSKANLCFTIYRRLRLATGTIPNESLMTVISAGLEGLHASVRCAQQQSPWWHVVNVPFQFICILLAMDTPSSLVHVKEAVTALKTVVNCFKTNVAQKALATIEQLISLFRGRKEADVVTLKDSLLELCDDPETTTGYEQDQHHMMDPAQFQLSHDFPWNSPDLDGVDWDQLFNMPFVSAM